MTSETFCRFLTNDIKCLTYLKCLIAELETIGMDFNDRKISQSEFYDKVTSIIERANNKIQACSNDK